MVSITLRGHFEDNSEAFQGVLRMLNAHAFELYSVKVNLPADYGKFQSYSHVARLFQRLFV